MALEKLFEQFCTEKTYLYNVSPATLRFYRGSWSVIQKHLPIKLPEELSKGILNDLVIALRKSGQSPKSVNTHISFFNSFLSWLFEEKQTAEHLKIKRLRLEQTIFKVFKEEHIRVILRFQPNGYHERRLWTSLCLLLDTGMRINELLSLRDEDVKFDQQVIIVKGKGGKERFVHFSTEMRKILWKFAKQKTGLQINGGIFFATTAGTQVTQRNFLRDMKKSFFL